MNTNNKKHKTIGKRLLSVIGVSAMTMLSAGCVSSDNSLPEQPQSAQAVQIKYAVGGISKQDLIAKYPEFTEQYDQYIASDDELAAANSIGSDVYIKAFFGTWCHDSVREVPRLLKSFKKSNADIELIALDIQKTDPLGLSVHLDVKYTPTFIVFKSGVEIGRIVERPEQSLAEDIAGFITNK